MSVKFQAVSQINLNVLKESFLYHAWFVFLTSILRRIGKEFKKYKDLQIY